MPQKRASGTTGLALILLGENIPAIGPRLQNRADAIHEARRFMEAIDRLIVQAGVKSYRMIMLRQPDGRFTLLIRGGKVTLEALRDMDELLLRRFQKASRRGLFILTCFFEGENGMECLAVTDGLGAVMYTPGNYLPT